MTLRIITDDGEGGGGGGLGSGGTSSIAFYDCNWTRTAGTPSTLATGMDLALHTGSNPADQTTWLGGKTYPVPTAETRLVVSQSVASGVTPSAVKFSLRELFPWGPGSWTTVGSGVTPTLMNIQTAAVDNLIPNPTSELGTLLLGYGSALVVNDAGNSYHGNYCRKLDSSAANQTDLTPKIPCVYSDQFTFDCYVKGSSATPILQLVLTFYDASGASAGTSTSAAYTGSTSYQVLRVQGSVPSGAVTVAASVKASTTAGSSFLYIDNLSLRRSVKASQMADAEGFRLINALANTGVTNADRVYYRGNNDPNTLGGAPNIGTLTLTRKRWDTTSLIGRLDLSLQPAAATDNLDGMRHAKIDWYRQSAVIAAASGPIQINVDATAKTFTRVDGGSFITDGFTNGQSIKFSGFTNGGNNGTFTISAAPTASVITCSAAAGLVTETGNGDERVSSGTGTLTSIDTTYVPLADRLFNNTTDSNTANATKATAPLQDAAINAGFPAAVVTIYNASGPSAGWCFFAKTGNADGSVLSQSGIAWPPGLTGGSGGGSGGGGGGGGSCPAPWVLVDLPGGLQKRADELEVGDLVQTIHGTGTLGAWPVKAVGSAESERWDVHLDGLAGPLTFAPTHRLRTEQGWTEVQDLVPGQLVLGEVPQRVVAVEARDFGPVVEISIDQAATYQTSGLLSSNIKIPTP